jgi:hypothetical protein
MAQEKGGAARRLARERGGARHLWPDHAREGKRERRSRRGGSVSIRFSAKPKMAREGL